MIPHLLAGLAATTLTLLLSPQGRGARVLGSPSGSGRVAGLRWLATKKQRKSDSADVRLLLSQVAALLRAGAPPGAAWRRAAGVRVDEVGVPDPRALAQIFGARPAATMTAATRLALNLGAPLAVVLGTIGHVLTAEAEAAAERDAMLAGPQTTARVLLALPVLGMGIGWLLGVNPLKNTFGGGLGTVSVALGVGFMVAGRCWITRMIASAKASGEVT